MAVRTPPPTPPAQVEGGGSGRTAFGDQSRTEKFNTVSGWMGTLQGAYAAGQSENPVDIASSLMSGFAMGGPWGLAAAAVIVAFSIHRNNKEERKERRKAAKRILAFGENEPEALPLLYGYGRTPMIPIYSVAVDSIRPSSNYAEWNWDRPQNAPLQNGRSTGALPANASFSWTTGLLGQPGQAAILALQSDIAANQMTGIVDLSIDGIWLNNRTITGAATEERNRAAALRNYSYHVLGDPGVPAEFMLDAPASVGYHPRLRRDSNTLFTNKSYLSSLFWQADREPIVGNEFPVMELLWQGGAIRGIERLGGESEEDPPTYAFSEDLDFSQNPVLVLIDLLIRREDVQEDEFDLQTYYEAMKLSSIKWSGLRSDIQFLDSKYPHMTIVNGTLVEDPANTRTYRDELQERSRSALEPNSLQAVVLYDIGYEPLEIGSEETRGGGGHRTIARVAYEKQQWMFNGPVPTDIPSNEQQEIILECIPGSFTFRTDQGLSGISVPDYTRSAVEQSEGTIDENILVQAPVIGYPDGTEKLTGLNTKFRDASKQFDYEEAVYPVAGTPLALELLKATNGVSNIQNLEIEGAIDPDQAHSIACSQILQSHRFLGQIQVKANFIVDIKEGSIVRLIYRQDELDAYVRIMTKAVVGSVARLDVQEFYPEDYKIRTIDIVQEPLALSQKMSIRKPAAFDSSTELERRAPRDEVVGGSAAFTDGTGGEGPPDGGDTGGATGGATGGDTGADPLITGAGNFSFANILHLNIFALASGGNLTRQRVGLSGTRPQDEDTGDEADPDEYPH